MVVQFMPVIPIFGKQRQEDSEFLAILCYITRLCLKETKTKPIVKRQIKDNIRNILV